MEIVAHIQGELFHIKINILNNINILPIFFVLERARTQFEESRITRRRNLKVNVDSIMEFDIPLTTRSATFPSQRVSLEARSATFPLPRPSGEYESGSSSYTNTSYLSSNDNSNSASPIRRKESSPW